MKKQTLFSIILLCSIVFANCTIYEATLTMEETEFPVSMNEYLYSSSMNEIGPGDYEKVGSFKFSRYMSGLFHGAVPITKTEFDLSDDINDAIVANEGNAMVNFRISTSSNALTTTVVGGAGSTIMPIVGMSMMLTGNLVGGSIVLGVGAALPNISKVVVKGDIVRINPRYVYRTKVDIRSLIRKAVNTATGRK